MIENTKQPVARPVFRWLAAIAVPVFAAMTVVALFELLDDNGKPDALMTGFFAWIAAIFWSIAATGRYEFSLGKPLQILTIAKKLSDGEIALEEYRSRTKEIMQGS